MILVVVVFVRFELVEVWRLMAIGKNVGKISCRHVVGCLPRFDLKRNCSFVPL